MKTVTIWAIIIIIIVTGWFMFSNPDGEKNLVTEENGTVESEEMMEKEGMVGDEVMMIKGGSYEEYSPEKVAFADSGSVVLFFRASWCPTCRALDKDIRANLDAIPDNVLILDVNYDDSTTLKQKHGVVYQHTLVQVDADGNQIAKWTSSPTLSSILENIK